MHKNNFTIKTVPMPECIKEQLMEFIFDLCRTEKDTNQLAECKEREPAILEDKPCKN